MQRPIGPYVEKPVDTNKYEASLAHEINNPLESLRNIFFLMEGDPCLSDEIRGYLQLAREEADRISQITHRSMQKFQAGRKNTDISTLLRSVVEFYKSRLESKGISLKMRFCQNSKLSVCEPELRQSFSNLLLNASDAMPDGGELQARVSVAHERSGMKRYGLRVTVADNGCGIKDHDLKKIWEPYFTTKGSAGNGIGLSFVRETVQKLGGVLRVRTSTKRGRSGSVFAVFLPS